MSRPTIASKPSSNRIPRELYFKSVFLHLARNSCSRLPEALIPREIKSVCHARCSSRSSFVDQIERRFHGAAEASEACRIHDLAHPFLSGLSAKTQSHFLRARTGRA